MSEDAEFDEQLRLASACLLAGGRVLLAGSPPGTFRDLDRETRIILMPSSEPGRLDMTRLIPAEVNVVVLTRMLSHALSRNLRAQAKTRNIYITSPLSDGSARRFVHALLERSKDRTVPRVKTPVVAAPAAPAAPATPAAPAAPAAPEPVTSVTLQMLDEAIAELQLVRESVAAMLLDAAQRSADLETLNRLRALLK